MLKHKLTLSGLYIRFKKMHNYFIKIINKNVILVLNDNLSNFKVKRTIFYPYELFFENRLPIVKSNTFSCFISFLFFTVVFCLVFLLGKCGKLFRTISTKWVTAYNAIQYSTSVFMQFLSENLTYHAILAIISLPKP